MKGKVLVVCSAGAKRSNIMAFYLKMMGYDAIAVGIDKNSPETIHMLSAWADKIVLAQPDIWMQRMPEEFRHKVLPITIGPDVWSEMWPHDLDVFIRQLLLANHF